MRKRWIETVNDCLKKRGLDVRQTRRMVHDRWGEYMGRCLGDEPCTLMRCHSCEFLHLCEAHEGRKSVFGHTHNLRA